MAHILVHTEHLQYAHASEVLSANIYMYCICEFKYASVQIAAVSVSLWFHTHREIEVIDGITEEKEAEMEEKHVHQPPTDSRQG